MALEARLFEQRANVLVEGHTFFLGGRRQLADVDIGRKRRCSGEHGHQESGSNFHELIGMRTLANDGDTVKIIQIGSGLDGSAPVSVCRSFTDP
jgi:hypothetical protein